jgi:hypothetical protein
MTGSGKTAKADIMCGRAGPLYALAVPNGSAGAALTRSQWPSLHYSRAAIEAAPRAETTVKELARLPMRQD